MCQEIENNSTYLDNLSELCGGNEMVYLKMPADFLSSMKTLAY